MNIVKSLREQVAKAMWEAGECPMPWDELDPKMDAITKREFLRMADAAIVIVGKSIANVLP